jgi:superfamily I DNA/RNA helicase
LGPEEKAARCAELVEVSDPAQLALELDADPMLSTSVADEGETPIEKGGGTSAVELLTIVGAKGLSAKHVIVVGRDDVNMAHTTPLAFYVALTRARESLHLITAAKAGGAKAAHPFLLDLPEEYCEFVVHKKSASAEKLVGQDAFEARLAQWDRVARRHAAR